MTSAHTDSKIIITTDPATLRRWADKMEKEWPDKTIGDSMFVDTITSLRDGTQIHLHMDQDAMRKVDAFAKLTAAGRTKRCGECGGTGVVHSHNPKCYMCDGTGYVPKNGAEL